ncbi:precorrin methylase, partial [Cereibacter changlensis JA139]
MAGIGFNSRATGASIRDALAQAGGAEALATAETKAAALRGLAPGLPVRGIAP